MTVPIYTSLLFSISDFLWVFSIATKLVFRSILDFLSFPKIFSVCYMK